MVPVLPHPFQHLLLFLPLIMAILTEVRWNLSVVWIYISSITRKVEYFFMYLLAICTSSFENSLFNSCAHFFLGCWFFGGWVFWVPCRLWILVPYRMSSWQRFFSHSVGCLLSPVTVFFVVQKLFSLMKSHLIIVSLRCWAFWVLFRKLFSITICSSVFPTASWSCFSFSGLILRSLIHAHGLAESTLWKWPYYQKKSTCSMQSLQNSNDSLHRNRKSSCEIHMETQRTLNS
jgi:hypothetical protein